MKRKRISILTAMSIIFTLIPIFEVSAAAEPPSGGIFDVKFGKGMVVNCGRTFTAKTDESGNQIGYDITASYIGLPYETATATGLTSIELGQYIELGTYNGEDILWRCVAFEKATRQSDGTVLIDSTETSATYSAVGENEGDIGYLPLMIADQIITFKTFDAKGTSGGSHDRGDSNRDRYGSHYWGDSNLRTWLNGDYAANGASWPCGNAPTKANCANYNGYDTEAGFLNSANFSTQAKAAIAEVTQKTHLSKFDQGVSTKAGGTKQMDSEGYVHTAGGGAWATNYYSDYYYELNKDKMFLLDVKQLDNMYANTKNDKNSANTYYYVGTATEGAAKQSTAGGYSVTANTSNYYTWLRAPYYRFSLYVRSVGSGGQVDGSRAYYGDGGVRPAFFLNPSSANFDFGSGTSDAPYRFYKGEGTADNPYEIPDLETLEAFRDKVNGGKTYEGKHFKLTADIDLNGSEENQWMPIGNQSNHFNGTFDGGGHTVSGIYVDGFDYQGLFGNNAGTIRNVTVTGQVGSWSRIGGICGSNSGLVENCKNMCAVKLLNIYAYYIGGICGYNTGTIKNCVNEGEVNSVGGGSGSDYFGNGGICGYNAGGTIISCYNTGKVSGGAGSEKNGGVCGYNTGTITSCYNIGEVSGQGTLSGVCGYNSSGQITNCYYDSEKCAANDMNEGVTGKTTTEFALGEVARLLQGDSTEQIWGQALSGSADASPVLMSFLTDEEKAEKTVYTVKFATQDNANYAVRYANSGGTVTLPDEPTSDIYAFMKWSQTEAVNGTKFTSETTVTEDITVYAVGEEKYGATDADKNITVFSGLPKTIDLSEYVAFADSGASGGSFTYNFKETPDEAVGASITDGKLMLVPNAVTENTSYQISITATAENNISLFSVTDAGFEPVTITLNLTVKPCVDTMDANLYNIPDYETLCAFAAAVNGGNDFAGKTVKLTADIVANENVLNADGTLNGDGSNFEQWTPIGHDNNPFKGSFDGGGHTISGLYFNNSASSYVGLFGYLDTNGKIKNVGVADSYLAGSYAVGGVCGYCASDTAVTSCYNTGVISGKNDTGGVCGYCAAGTTVTNCYNTGKVFGGNETGGVCGYNSHGTIENCYNIGAVRGSSYVGGVCGGNNGAVTSCYSIAEIWGVFEAGGVCGHCAADAAFTNCYYDNTVYSAVDETAGVVGKTTDKFTSGEIAKLLQNDSTEQIWGQSLNGTDARPVLLSFLTYEEKAAKTVYKVTFKTQSDTVGTDYATVYANPSGVGTGRMPTMPEITDTNYVFAKWATAPEADAFTATTQITEDITLNAYKQEQYGEVEGNKVVTTTYGTEKTQDLSAYVDYAGGTAEANNFTYTIDTAVNSKNESVKDSGYFPISDDTLTVADTTPAGTYTLNITAHEKAPQISLFAVGFGTSDVTFSVTVTVNKAMPTVTAPTKKTDLSYTGSAHELIAAGSTTGGTIKYSLTENGEYSETIPKGADAGNYTVWYKVDGGNNYNDVAAQSVNVTISKASNSWTTEPIIANVTYGTAINPQGAAKFGTVTVTYTGIDGTSYDASATKPTEVGSYKATFTVAGTDNYTELSEDVEFNITQIAAIVDAAPTAKTDLVYNGAAQALVTAGTATGGTMKYSLTENGDYSETIPTGTNAGDYTVWYKVEGDHDHSDTVAVRVDVTISPKSINDAVIDNIENQTYTGSAIEPVVTVKDGSATLTLNTDYTISYSDNVNVGKATVTITGQGNYNETKTVEFDIVKTGSQTEITGSNVTYGETLTLTANVSKQLTAINSLSLFSVDADKVAFYVGDTLLDTVSIDYGESNKDNGTATLTIDTTQKQLAVGANTIKAVYGGSVNLNGSNSDIISVTLNAKPITLIWEGADTRVYDGNANNLTASSADILTSDNVSVNVNGGTETNAGRYTATAALMGDNAAYYTITSNTKEYVINKAEPTYTTPTELTAKVSQTLADITLPYGWAWKDSTTSVGNAGINQFAAVFTPNDTANYNTIEMNLSITVTDTNTDDVVKPGETVQKGDTTVTNNGDGTVTIDNGDTETTIKLPSESENVIVDKDGNVTVPSGAKVTTGDTEIELPNGGKVDKDGNVTGNSIKIGETTITAPDGETVKTDKDGNTVVKPNVVIENDNIKTTVDEGEGMSDKDGNITFPDSGKVTVEKDGEKITVDVEKGETVKPSEVKPTPTSRPHKGGSSGSSSYTVTFNANNGDKNTTSRVSRNTVVKEPAVPTKEGYIFDGWYADSKLTEKYDFSTKVTKSFTLYAKWTETVEPTQKPSETSAPNVTPTPSIVPETNPFVDVHSSDWFYENVMSAYNDGLMSGVSGTEFGPYMNITRGMFVTVLYRIEGEPQITADNRFTDVPTNEYYTSAVEWANANGIVNGYSDTKFEPYRSITREQMAAIIYRYAKFKDYDTSINATLTYSDSADISDYAKDAVIWNSSNGILQGNEDNTFVPQSNATRAEAAAVFTRIEEKLK